MKKIVLISISFGLALSTMAQSLKDVKKLIYTNNYAQAQTEVNKFLAMPGNENNPDAWFYKAKAYYALSTDSTLNFDKSFAMKNVSYDAYKKYQEIDAKAEMLSDEKNRPFLYLYDGYYNLGISAFNEKNFKNSYNAFSKALEIEDFIKAKGYTYEDLKFSAFDTSLTMNTAITAFNAKDTVNAMKAYAKFAAAGIGGANNQGIYEALIDYYLNHGDKAKAEETIVQGRKLYPGEAAWDSWAVKIASDGNINNKFAKYDEVIAGNPNSFALHYNYAADMYNSLYARDQERPADLVATKKRLTEVLEKTIPLDKGMDALMLMTNHKYNMAADLSTLQSTEKDPKKKAELLKQMNAAFMEVVPYAQQVVAKIDALPETKSGDRATKKNVLGYLQDVYDITGNKAKADEYGKLRAAVVI